MESKLKKDSIQEYARTYAQAVSDPVFEEKAKITGKELLNLCEIKQINLFILMDLFKSWEHEMDKLKSPFFNYDHPEVMEAMKRFHNTVSNHIEINQKDFLPLFEKAVEKTLNLIFSPYHFYVEEYGDEKNADKEELSKLLKYIRINPHLHQSLLDRLQSDQKYSGEELINLFDELCAESPDIPEDFEEYIKIFSTVIPLDLSMIYAEEEEELAEEEIEKQVSILNDRFNKENETLNDKIKAKLDSTLAEIHQNKKIENIAKSISINQRYQFTKQLFKGDKNALEQAVEELDKMQDMENAVNFTETLARSQEWDMDSEEVTEFMLLVRRRFES